MRLSRFAQLLALALAAVATLTYAGIAPANPATPFSATGFTYVKTIDQAVCQTIYTGGFVAEHYTRGDCTRIDFTVSGSDATTAVKGNLIGPNGTTFKTVDASRLSSGLWRFVFRSDATWPAGKIRLQVTANGTDAGEGSFFVNGLGADLNVTPKANGKPYEPGEVVTVSGSLAELNDVAGNTQRNGTAGAFSLQIRKPDGEVRGPYGPFTASSDGTFSGIQLPAAATRGLTADATTNFRLGVAIDVIDAKSTNLVSGDWANAKAGEGSLSLISRPSTLLLQNSFVSSVGWVKPGQAYPFRVFVKNFTDEWKNDVSVTIPAPAGVIFTAAHSLKKAGTVSSSASSVTWTLPSIATDTTATLIVEARAQKTTEDARIVWKDLSTEATMTYTGGPTQTSETHGPKVIPPTGGYETSRYGDKPFPVIPVDFRDRKHKANRNGELLADVINSPQRPGSTYNLYQEMSYGQLFPFADVPSAEIASAKFDYDKGFMFTDRDLKKPTCRGATIGGVQQLWGTPAYPERIHDGWYQLPGDTEYYGGDFPVFTLQSAGIDSACGDTAKMIYDAVQIADPEIDYNEFDSDKDGVVDFTMVVFAGCGGNGSSQLGAANCEDTAPYDNPWPHSSTLEATYKDPVTGLDGYSSDDQLTDLEGTPQCWLDATYSDHADCESAGGPGLDNLPVYVRVGPYNINPETAIDHASVISHEYGHHLGLPDYYSSYSAYNDWNLMASDYSQHMTVFSKQDLGWVVPRYLQPGQTRKVQNWNEIKNDTGEIQWQTAGGQPYTLSAANGDQKVHNGDVYGLKLPHRLLIDPQKVEQQASAPYLWWSGRGNDFGCVPKAAHNLDVTLPELEFLPEGTPVTMTFKSSWDIEWDFDYGFVMATTNGTDYVSLPSAKSYTTPVAVNPNGNACQQAYGNGITGTSGAYAGGPAQVAADRASGSVASGSPFVTDQYDLSSYVGKRGTVLRFSYSTDPGLDRPGWFIDDLVVKAGDKVIYSSDFSSDEDLRLFPGGCGANGVKTAAKCTPGWNRIKADQPSDLDHAYYLELRDRSGFDFASHGQADRGNLAWEPGALIEYTDEVRGYGNNGGEAPPRQHYLDSQPQPGYDCGDNLNEDRPEVAVLTDPRCEDAAFTAAAGDSHFADQGWIDNFWDDSAPDALWHFDYGCLTFDVTSMTGNTGNTEALPSDLKADATISAGQGCQPFDYWAGTVNAAPTANATATPKNPVTGQSVTFDSAGTFDDLQPASELTYEWTFGDGTSASGTKATHAYTAKGSYAATLKVTDAKGLSSTATVPLTVTGPDLQVTNVVAAAGKVPSNGQVVVTATVTNVGPGAAPASKTQILYDGFRVLGVVDTQPLAKGQSVNVTAIWNASGVKGEHSLRATTDQPGAVAEENEANNTAHRLVTVTGGRVVNGSFQQG